MTCYENFLIVLSKIFQRRDYTLTYVTEVILSEGKITISWLNQSDFVQRSHIIFRKDEVPRGVRIDNSLCFCGLLVFL